MTKFDDDFFSMSSISSSEPASDSKFKFIGPKSSINKDMLFRKNLVDTMKTSSTPVFYESKCKFWYPWHFLEYDKIAKVKERIQEIQSELTEIEFFEILQQCNSWDLFPKFLNSKNDIFHLLKHYKDEQWSGSQKDALRKTELVNPIMKQKERKLLKKVKQSRVLTEVTTDDSSSFESMLWGIEKQYRIKQFDQLNKFEDYFKNEVNLKNEYKAIQYQRSQIVSNIEGWEWYGKVILTKIPLFSSTPKDIIERYRKLGNKIFENEFTHILEHFIEGKLRFNPVFWIVNYYSFDNSYVINIYEDLEQKLLFKSVKLENADLVFTGMTVESDKGQFEL